MFEIRDSFGNRWFTTNDYEDAFFEMDELMFMFEDGRSFFLVEV